MVDIKYDVERLFRKRYYACILTRKGVGDEHTAICCKKGNQYVDVYTGEKYYSGRNISHVKNGEYYVQGWIEFLGKGNIEKFRYWTPDYIRNMINLKDEYCL